MNTNRTEINQAITLYLGYGVAVSPGKHINQLNGIFNKTKSDYLVSKILLIMKSTNKFQIDWDNMDLVTAGNVFRQEMSRQYPELDDSSLDALVWKFTFDWR